MCVCVALLELIREEIECTLLAASQGSKRESVGYATTQPSISRIRQDPRVL
jgi:hypothetical protein